MYLYFFIWRWINGTIVIYFHLIIILRSTLLFFVTDGLFIFGKNIWTSTLEIRFRVHVSRSSDSSSNKRFFSYITSSWNHKWIMNIFFEDSFLSVQKPKILTEENRIFVGYSALYFISSAKLASFRSNWKLINGISLRFTECRNRSKEIYTNYSTQNEESNVWIVSALFFGQNVLDSNFRSEWK